MEFADRKTTEPHGCNQKLRAPSRLSGFAVDWGLGLAQK